MWNENNTGSDQQVEKAAMIVKVLPNSLVAMRHAENDEG